MSVRTYMRLIELQKRRTHSILHLCRHNSCAETVMVDLRQIISPDAVMVEQRLQIATIIRSPDSP